MIVIKKNYKYPWFKPFVDKSIKNKIGKIFDKNLNTMGLKTKELENKLKKCIMMKNVYSMKMQNVLYMDHQFQ